MRVDEIRRLIELVERSGIDELEVRHWWNAVRIVRSSRRVAPVIEPVPPSHPEPVGAPSAASPAPPESTAAADEQGLVPIVSPMVGTFYRASSPSAPAYVEAGQRVEVGQVVCIVEAMKLMNEIESEVAGTVARVLLENGQPVEFNQPLFLLKPD
jgi:acetyl-CoA carboxylase biotin carboxyl carrier protein